MVDPSRVNSRSGSDIGMRSETMPGYDLKGLMYYFGGIYKCVVIEMGMISPYAVEYCLVNRYTSLALAKVHGGLL